MLPKPFQLSCVYTSKQGLSLGFTRFCMRLTYSCFTIDVKGKDAFISKDLVQNVQIISPLSY